VVNAVPTTFSITRPGHNGRYTFSGIAGQAMSITWAGATLPGGSNQITVYRPEGGTVASTGFGQSTPSGALDFVLPATGTYTVFVDPYQVGTGQVQLALKDTAAGTLTVDGASLPVSLSTGQNGRYVFTGSAGQMLGLGITAVSATPVGSVAVRVFDPSGTLLTDCYGFAAPGSCNLKRLPQSGTYSVLVDPPATSSANVTLTLSSDLAGSIVLNAATPTTFATTRPGQNGRYTFNANAGQHLHVAWSDVTLPGSNYFAVYSPTGAVVVNQSIGSSQTSGNLDIDNLPATGTYTVFVDPALANTGQVRLSFREPVTGVLTVNGAAIPTTLLPSQNARFTFAGTAGQVLGLGVSSLSITNTPPAVGYLAARVYDPTGVLATDCGSSNTSFSCDLKPLLHTGTYVVVLDVPGTQAASMTVTLSANLSGALTLNSGSVLFSSDRPGQNGRYTFAATAGHRIGISWSDATIPGSWSYIKVYSPTGAVLLNQIFSPSAPSGNVELAGYLTTTGTYTVAVDPSLADTGQVRLYASRAFTGTLVPEAAPTPLSLPMGGMAEYAFWANAGQVIGAVLTDIVTAPAAPSTDPLTMQLINPAGVVVRTCKLGSSYSPSCRFPAFGSGGTYKLLIKSGPNTASFNLQLRSTL
jgi:large repetitive protein